MGRSARVGPGGRGEGTGVFDEEGPGEDGSRRGGNGGGIEDEREVEGRDAHHDKGLRGMGGRTEMVSSCRCRRWRVRVRRKKEKDDGESVRRLPHSAAPLLAPCLCLAVQGSALECVECSCAVLHPVHSARVDVCPPPSNDQVTASPRPRNPNSLLPAPELYEEHQWGV